MSHMPHTSMDHTMNTCHCIVQDITTKQLCCTLNLNFLWDISGIRCAKLQKQTLDEVQGGCSVLTDAQSMSWLAFSMCLANRKFDQKQSLLGSYKI